jgi:hypothetical protein
MGVVKIDARSQPPAPGFRDSGRHRRPVASVSSAARWNRTHPRPRPDVRGHDGLPHRTRPVVMDGFVMLGPNSIFGGRGQWFLRTRCDVLRAVLLVGSGPGERRAYACSLRNCVQVGPTRRGAGPRLLCRSSVAIVVADTSIPSFRSSPLILR